MFAAVLRMITDTNAEAEWWQDHWAREYFSGPYLSKLDDDGTVQISVETLPEDAEHIRVSHMLDACPELASSTYLKIIDDALATAFRQGYAKSVRDRVITGLEKK